MHKVKFYPIGNADTCFIHLDNDRRIIFDYANTFDPNDDDEKRVDLEKHIREDIGDSKKVDVFAISHLDKDHYQGASEIFWLEHALKYQSRDRIKIETLWVPAAAILEEGITDEGRVLRTEARHRLKEGSGVRIFSHPDALDSWFKDNHINPEDRRELITNAGELTPEFSLVDDGVEFFVHSPFAERGEDGSLIIRNASALFMQVTFEIEGTLTRLILSADGSYELIEGIVRVTKAHKNEERLMWDINNIPHHCSYKSLSSDKGKDKTIPTEEVDWLYSQQGEDKGLLISTSDVIPSEDTKQPPHRQAAAYYKEIAASLDGEFLVTMEEPTTKSPKPIVVEISRKGPRCKRTTLSPIIVSTSTRTPRAG